LKLFVAYTIVVIGIPYLVGLLFGQILTLPLSMIVGLFRKPTDEATQSRAFVEATTWSLRSSVKMSAADRVLHVCMDVFNGFGAVLTAGFIFHLFGLYPAVAVPVIVAAWEIAFTVAYGQAFRALISSLVGLVIGWFVVLRLFSP
jgi:hypothetical protein